MKHKTKKYNPTLHKRFKRLIFIEHGHNVPKFNQKETLFILCEDKKEVKQKLKDTVDEIKENRRDFSVVSDSNTILFIDLEVQND